jgi:hypothetical protein
VNSVINFQFLIPHSLWEKSNCCLSALTLNIKSVTVTHIRQQSKHRAVEARRCYNTRVALSGKNTSHILIDTWEFLLACLPKTVRIYPSVKCTRNKTFDLSYLFFFRYLRYTLYFILIMSLHEVSVLLRHGYIPDERVACPNWNSLVRSCYTVKCVRIRYFWPTI